MINLRLSVMLRLIFFQGADDLPEDGRVVLDDLPWDAISRRHGSRDQDQCRRKWFQQLSPSMVARGVLPSTPTSFCFARFSAGLLVNSDVVSSVLRPHSTGCAGIHCTSGHSVHIPSLFIDCRLSTYLEQSVECCMMYAWAGSTANSLKVWPPNIYKSRIHLTRECCQAIGVLEMIGACSRRCSGRAP